MADEAALKGLQQDVQYLLDRTAILDCVARHARGDDRQDVELLTGTYHPDGIDEHGRAIISGSDYAEWVNAIHAASSSLHLHHITTHLCEIDGDIAHCESYVIDSLLDPDETTARMYHGRYIDRLERRDGEWKIALRRAIVDLVVSGDASLLKSPTFQRMGYTKGVRDRRDLSYRRPLTMDEPAERW
jgi:SnoaL-like protein